MSVGLGWLTSEEAKVLGRASEILDDLANDTPPDVALRVTIGRPKTKPADRWSDLVICSGTEPDNDPAFVVPIESVWEGGCDPPIEECEEAAVDLLQIVASLLIGWRKKDTHEAQLLVARAIGLLGGGQLEWMRERTAGKSGG